MSYKFFFGEALRGLRRNLSITIAMIITSSIALVMLGVGLLIANMAENSKEQWVDRTEISIFIEPKVAVKDKDCSKKGCGDLREALLESDSVKSVRYRNQQQSLDVGRLTARADTAEIFEQADAKAMPGTLLVKLKGENTDPAPIEAIVAKFPKVAQPAVHGKDGRPSVYISDSRQLINRLFSFLDLTRNAAYGLAAFLGVGALLLIANMVQMAAFTRRKTTQVMRLVGASRFTVAAPFTLEVMISSLFGAVLAIAGLFAVHAWMLSPLLKNVWEGRSIAEITTTDVWLVSPILVIVALVASALASIVTLPLYVRR
ncbi:MAG: permease-like cell division protein FtsX [Lawsonella sp.]